MSTKSIDDEIGALLMWARILEFKRRAKRGTPLELPHPNDFARAMILRDEAQRLVDLQKQALQPAT